MNDSKGVLIQYFNMFCMQFNTVLFISFPHDFHFFWSCFHTFLIYKYYLKNKYYQIFISLHFPVGYPKVTSVTVVPRNTSVVTVNRLYCRFPFQNRRRHISARSICFQNAC